MNYLKVINIIIKYLAFNVITTINKYCMHSIIVNINVNLPSRNLPINFLLIKNSISYIM